MKSISKVILLVLLIGITGCSSAVKTESIVSLPMTEILSPVQVEIPQIAVPQPATTENAVAVTANDQKIAAAAVINNVKKSGLKVALTFDDGPDEKFTPRILDILKKEQVKATFFVVGIHAKEHPQMMKRIVEEGHVIGNHSWDHLNLAQATPDKIQSEIALTDDVIKQITGVTPTLFRAPYGVVSPQVVKESQSSGHQIIGWSVDTLDWDGKSVTQILASVRKEVGPGGIILQHFAGGKQGNLNNTVEALPQIIAYLKQNGYTLVTIPELIAAK